jgi:hypothetical protein
MLGATLLRPGAALLSYPDWPEANVTEGHRVFRVT